MAWCEAIEHGKRWDRDMDAPRFRDAFKTVAATFDQWPTPRQFMEAMPARKGASHPPLRLIENGAQREERTRREEASKARIEAIIDATGEILRGKRDGT